MYKFINGKKVYETTEIDERLDPIEEGVATAISKADNVFDLATNASELATETATAFNTYKDTTDAKLVTMNGSIANAAGIASAADTKADTALNNAISKGIDCYITASSLPTSTMPKPAGYAITLDTLTLYRAIINGDDITWSPIGKLLPPTQE